MKTSKKLIVCTLLAAVAGCSTKAGTGAVVGGVGGAAVGGLIGSKSHARAGEGALIGGAIGAIGGGLVGHGMDKKDEEQARRDSDYQRTRDRSYQRSSDAHTAPSSSSRVTRAEVIEWSQIGVTDEIIIDRIQRSGTTFTVTAADEKQMREAGVSPGVIAAMKQNR